MTLRAAASVLLVDDDLAVTRVLAKMLRQDGYTVETALDGGAAIARLSRDERPAALVVDFRLPHADGLAVASYARSRFPGIPVVVVTSWPEQLGGATTSLDPRPVILGKPIDYARLSQELARLTQL